MPNDHKETQRKTATTHKTTTEMQNDHRETPNNYKMTKVMPNNHIDAKLLDKTQLSSCFVSLWVWVLLPLCVGVGGLLLSVPRGPLFHISSMCVYVGLKQFDCRHLCVCMPVCYTLLCIHACFFRILVYGSESRISSDHVVQHHHCRSRYDKSLR